VKKVKLVPGHAALKESSAPDSLPFPGTPVIGVDRKVKKELPPVASVIDAQWIGIRKISIDKQGIGVSVVEL